MSGTNENVDPSVALAASIHLNEDDWLQLLQKLTPSSIDNLQQTLKKLQQREVTVSASEKNNPTTTTVAAIATTTTPISQACISSLVSASTEPGVFTNQTTPLVMSVNVSKAAMPSMITVPSVLNVTAKAIPKPMHNTIVLPSSTLLIAPGHGQPIPLDSCLPVNAMNRLVVQPNISLVTTTAASGALTTTSAVLPDSFNSLNTLATAAAVAAASSGQTSCSSEPSSSTPTLLTTTASSTEPVSSCPDSDHVPTTCTTDCPETPGKVLGTNPVSSGSPTIRTSVDCGLFRSLCGLPSGTELTPQLLSSLGTSGLAVYPLQVAANGSTVFLATHAPNNSNSNNNTTTTIPPMTTTVVSNKSAAPAQSVTLVATTAASQFHLASPTSSASGVTPISLGSLFTAASPLLTSTPISKPKFKALLESGAQQPGDNRAAFTLVTSPTDVNRTAAAATAAVTGETNLHRFVLTDSSLATAASLNLSNSTLARLGPAGSVHHSAILGLRTIGQAPKRVALDDQRLVHTADGPKRLLLVSSQAKPVSVDSGLSLSCTNESLLSKALQPPRLPPLVTTSARIDASDLSSMLSHVNHLASDSKCPVTTGTTTTTAAPTTTGPHPLLSPVSILPDVRSVSSGPAPTSTTTTTEPEPVSTSLESRVEAILNVGFEGGGRRMFKEEPVGEDEARRRAKRRERNRVAAARCRQRRQDQIADLQHRVSALTKTGEELRCSLISLNAERSRLESVIRQHGSDGCPEAEAILSTCSTNSDAPGLTTEDGKERQPLAPHPRLPSSTATLLSADVLRTSRATGSTPSSPGLILITNSLTNPMVDSMDSNRAKPTLAKLDLRPSTLLAAPPNLVLSTALTDRSGATGAASTPESSNGGVGPMLTRTIKIDEPQTGTTSDAVTITTTSSTSTPIARLAARPVTLIPTTRLGDLKHVLADQTAAPQPGGGTPTPCFWPSDLQSFSPLLTPSTWKLLKNLTEVAAAAATTTTTSTSCNTPQSFILTPTFSSFCAPPTNLSTIGGLVNSYSLAPSSSSTGSLTSASSSSQQEVMNLFAAAVAQAADTTSSSSSGKNSTTTTTTALVETPPSMDESDPVGSLGRGVSQTSHSVAVKPEPLDELEAVVDSRH